MALSVAARYQIILKDQTGTIVAIFDNFASIDFTRRVNDVGDYTLIFEDDDDSRFDLFELDGQIEIWRSVPAIGLDWYREFEGLHRNFSRNTEEDGRKFFASVGVGYNHLLSRRAIGYRHGTTRAEKNDYIEDVMKEYVDENAGPSANHSSRVRNGVFTNFSVEAESGSHTQTSVWKGDRGFKSLLDVLKELSAYSLSTVPTYRAIDFAVVNNGDGAFIFRTYLDQLGIDHTVGGGGTPVIFSVSFGNLQDFSHEVDRLSEVNSVIVLGKGERSTQKVIVRENSTDGAESDWNDIEIVRSASSNEFEYQLNDYGDGVLREMGYEEGFYGRPMQTESTLYGLHYTLGDKVTLRYGTTEMDKKIIAINLKMTGDTGREQLSVDWEDVP